MSALPVELPFIQGVDVLVVGATSPGVAIALACCTRGQRTLLLERKTHCAAELGLWHRPFFFDEPACGDLMTLLFPPPARKGDALCFVPDAMKRVPEDALLTAGCTLLYGCAPVAAAFDGVWQITVGNRSGMQIVHAKQVIDATESGELTALLPPKLRSAPVLAYEPDTACIVAEIRHAGRLSKGVTADQLSLSALRCVPGTHGDNLLIDMCMSPQEDAWMCYETAYQAFALLKRQGALPAAAAIGVVSDKPMPGSGYHPLHAAKRALTAWESNPQAPCLRIFPALEGCAPIRPGALPAGDLRYENELTRYYGYPQMPATLRPNVLEDEYDVLVIGGGSAGAMAAYAASKEGARVCLADMNAVPGGTGTAGGVHYYWFGNRRGFTRALDDRYFAYAGLIGQPPIPYAWGFRDGWNPSIRAHTLRTMLREENVCTLQESLCVGIFRDGNRVTGALFATTNGPLAVRGRVVIDATGDGDAAALAGAAYVYGGRSRFTMWSSLAQYADAGLYRGGVFTTSADIGDVFDSTRYLLVNRRRGPQSLYDHGSYLTTRESRHIAGDYTVTYRDILLNRIYEDTIHVGFSNHDPKGASDSDAIYAGSLPSQQPFTLPYRAFLAKGLEGLYVTGKAISATHDAMPMTRMQDDVQEQGGAIGIAAATCAREGLRVRQLPLDALREKLITMGSLKRRELEPPAPQPCIAALVASLTGAERFTICDLDKNARVTQTPPVWSILMADPEEAAPPLLARLKGASGGLALLLSRLLLWHGAQEGLPDVLGAIWQELRACPGLPLRRGSRQWSQLYPDQGHMAEISYDISLLFRADSAAVFPIMGEMVERIAAAQRDYADKAQCVFGHIDVLARVASQSPHSGYVPLLEKLLALPEIGGEIVRRAYELDTDPLRERMAMLRYYLGKAIARCGGQNGYISLAGQTEDKRIIIAKTAADTLHALTGAWHGLNASAWLAAIGQMEKPFGLCPEGHSIL